MPEISVIIPMFNSEQFIADTLESTICQSKDSMEIIVVDDYSVDKSWDIVQEYQKKYPEFIKLYKNKGKGACAARNYGIQLSKGDYIQFLDADDILSPSKIEKQVAALKEKPLKLAVCETWNFNGNIEEARNTDAEYLFTTDQPEEFLINLWGGNDNKPPNMVQTSAWLTPRSLIEKAGLWDEELAKDQDGEFFARVAMHSTGIIYVSGIKNYYRKHVNGGNIASKGEWKHLHSRLKALESKEQLLSLKTNSNSFHKAMALQYKWIAVDAWPRFKDISCKALKNSEKHSGSKYSPVLGGVLIELIKKTLGWKVARSFTVWVHENKFLLRAVSIIKNK